MIGNETVNKSGKQRKQNKTKPVIHKPRIIRFLGKTTTGENHELIQTCLETFFRDFSGTWTDSGFQLPNLSDCVSPVPWRKTKDITNKQNTSVLFNLYYPFLTSHFHNWWLHLQLSMLVLKWRHVLLSQFPRVRCLWWRRETNLIITAYRLWARVPQPTMHSKSNSCPPRWERSDVFGIHRKCKATTAWN